MAMKFNKSKVKTKQQNNFVNAVGMSGGRRFTAENTHFVILPELQDLLPRLSKQEKRKLEDNVVREGIIDPLSVWKRPKEAPVLLDGHNRFEIAQRHGLDFPVKELEFDGVDSVKRYMIDLQMGKRNLVKWQVSFFRGLKYAGLKNGAGGERAGAGRKSKSQNETLNNETTTESKSHFETLNNDGDLLTRTASEFGVSRATLNRDYHFYLGVETLPEGLKEMFKARKVKLAKQFVEAIGQDSQKKEPSITDVKSFLSGKITIEEDNAEESDREWLAEFQDGVTSEKKAKPYKQIRPSSFLKSEQRKVEKMLEFESGKNLNKIKDVYLLMAKMIEDHIQDE
ncbi:hypothetical protein FUAX_43890 (plasmid) [Fulvitalea axinellae]|uniref:ParB/Sulfiredoxin domain-containing protein n=1 Tax=Fulvitalea axinellae TaxID=1182444 RepID=A0AAU9CYC2_9BACT|nr:hypothetical protein FUAX_43890 [Fulvitalea axinellae]